MTTQATNSLEYAEREWAIVARSGIGMFRPEDHGVFCREMHTGCCRGWVARYSITKPENVLCLSRLRVELDSEKHKNNLPVLFGKPLTTKNVSGFTLETYQDLNQPMLFTGGLLVGSDYQRERYLLAYTFPALDYGEVRELLFYDGVVTDAFDRRPEYERLLHLVKRQQTKLRHPKEIGERAWQVLLEEHRRQVEELMDGKLFFDDYRHDV